MLELGIVLRPILAFAVGFGIGCISRNISNEKMRFNKGKCIRCSTQLLVITANAKGHRVYECPNCNYSVTVKYNFIDRGYVPEEVYK